MVWIEWLIQNILYQYPNESLLVLGSITFILLLYVMKQAIYWGKFARNKRKVTKQIQQYLPK